MGKNQITETTCVCDIVSKAQKIITNIINATVHLQFFNCICVEMHNTMLHSRHKIRPTIGSNIEQESESQSTFFISEYLFPYKIYVSPLAAYIDKGKLRFSFSISNNNNNK